MLEILTQLKPTQGPVLEELAHTPALPWLVRSVATSGEYADLAASDVGLQMLDVYGADTWDTLARSPAFNRASVIRARGDCTYDDEHLAFYPVAILSRPPATALGLDCDLSARELALYDEKALIELEEGRLHVSADAKRMLGSGYTELLSRGKGVSLLSLQEIELSDHSTLLGWGWLWHRLA